MTEPRQFGRYVLCDEIAAGGMASVHLGRLTGPAGFARTVAIKRLQPQFAGSPEFVAMLLDEARLAARIRHPNVVSTLDVIATDGELLVVMDYVEGESFSHLQRICSVRAERVALNVVSAVVVQALLGLHAAHEATDENGRPLHLVHRDVSPQNLLVGTDGITRVLDFGVAKARYRLQSTDDGSVKGKLGYMAPEQLLQSPLDRRADVFAAGIVLWEGLTGKRLFANADSSRLITRILSEAVPPPSRFRPEVPAAVDAVVACALAKDAAGRYPTAREMALALDAAESPAGALEVGSWVESVAKETLDHRASRVARIERQEATPSGVSGLREILDSGPHAADDSEEPTEVGISGAISLGAGVRYTPRPPAPASIPPSARQRPKQSRRWRIAVLLALGVVAGAAFGLVLRARRTPQRSVIAAPSADPATFAASAESLGAAVAPSSRSVESPPPIRSAARTSRPPAAPAPHGAPLKPRSACNPPYVIDRETGIKRYKPECF
jgi:serine/threonine-protein kinase